MKKRNTFVVWSFLTTAIVFILAIFFIRSICNDHTLKMIKSEDSSFELFSLNRLRNGDAKLYDTGVITSVNGILTFIDFEGNIIKQHEDIKASWLDVCDDSIIVYGNSNKEIGICRFDEECNIVSNEVIIDIQETLGIDPSICKVDDEYYITVTHINGNVNNGDIKKKNGKYIVRLYKSKDLKLWKLVSEVISSDNNLEDIDLNYYNEKLVLTYEKETYDKLDSSICVTYSLDMGKTWLENKILVEEKGDNESASFIETPKGYCLFYSSDIENIGGSYETAKVYMKEFDYKFNQTDEAKEIPLLHSEGNLLYDVKIDANSVYYLFTEKYISQSNLILECIKAK